MRKITALRGRAGRPLAAGTLALAAVGASVLGATPAEAKAMSAKLTITGHAEPKSGGKYRVYINTLVPMNKYDADGYINNGARMEVTFYQDDPDSENFNSIPAFSAGGHTRTWRRYSTGLLTSEKGIHLSLSLLVPGSVLNEDKGHFNTLIGNTRDEIYYKVVFIDGDDRYSSKKSNIATGYFCC